MFLLLLFSVQILSGLASVAKKHKGSDIERYLKEMSKSCCYVFVVVVFCSDTIWSGKCC